jgi:hypothetical protein
MRTLSLFADESRGAQPSSSQKADPASSKGAPAPSCLGDDLFTAVDAPSLLDRSEIMRLHVLVPSSYLPNSSSSKSTAAADLQTPAGAKRGANPASTVRPSPWKLHALSQRHLRVPPSSPTHLPLADAAVSPKGINKILFVEDMDEVQSTSVLSSGDLSAGVPVNEVPGRAARTSPLKDRFHQLNLGVPPLGCEVHLKE